MGFVEEIFFLNLHQRHLLFIFTFAVVSGELAQLARALDWQSKGQGFDSPILHEVGMSVSVGVGNMSNGQHLLLIDN